MQKNNKINYKKILKKKNKKHIFNYINSKTIIKKKFITNFLKKWNNFYNATYTSNQKVIKKKKIHIANNSLMIINKNIIILSNIFKNKKKIKIEPRIKKNSIHNNIIKNINKQKCLKKLYKKINNILINIKIEQTWLKINDIPITLKTIKAFNETTKGWKKAIKNIKKNFNLERFSKNIYFENSTFHALQTCLLKNTESLTNNLCDNLKKQWKHRQQLFFTYFLLMTILWQFELKKITSFKKIKSFYLMIHGKINSGTRTKYFQIKAPYKPSMLTYKNHLNWTLGIAKAKTGVFGVKSWINY